MSKLKVVILAATVTALSAGLSSPVLAATAHNSQAGSFGPTTNNCAATPYFPADEGCASSYIARALDGGGTLPPPARYRRRGPIPGSYD